MFSINIATGELDRLAADFVATEKQFERALRSTLGKMAKWVKTRSVRDLAAQLKVPGRVVRRRVKVLKARKTSDGSQITIWYGQNPTALIYIGAARKSGKGVTVAGRHIEGGFVARGKGGDKQVFKRVGKSRLPLERQQVEVKEISDDHLQNDVVDGAAFAAQFYKVFEHELQWQTRS